MPISMPGNVARGDLLQSIRNRASLPNYDLWLDQAITELSSSTTRLVDVLVTLGILPNPGHPTAQMLSKHWFPNRVGSHPGQFQPGEAWWMNIQPIERVFRSGFHFAALLARFVDGDPAGTMRPKPLPVDGYWVCAGHYLEIVCVETDEQVTVLILTPTFPLGKRDGHPSEFPADENIWVIKADAVGPADHAPVRDPANFTVRYRQGRT